jgi:hypothetical protein
MRIGIAQINPTVGDRPGERSSRAARRGVSGWFWRRNWPPLATRLDIVFNALRAQNLEVTSTWLRQSGTAAGQLRSQ